MSQVYVPTISSLINFSSTGNIIGSATFVLVTFPLSSVGASYRFLFDVIVRVTASTGTSVVGDTMGYTLWSTFRTNGTTATIVETPFIDADEDLTSISASITMSASGNSVLLQFTPPANTNTAYTLTGRYIVV